MRGSFSVVAVSATAGLALLCTAMFGNQARPAREAPSSQIENRDSQFEIREAPASITVTNTNDSGPGSLRQALIDATSGSTIQFDPALNGQSITLTTTELSIHTGITINGPGPDLLTVRRDPQAPVFRIFHVTAGNPVIRGLTITGGAPNDRRGGAILNEGGATLLIENCNIHHNLSGGGLGATGGGIYNASGLITINQSTINNNSSLVGGGVFNGSQMQITDSSITANHAYAFSRNGEGGGITNSGTLTITDSDISNNAAGEPNPLPSPFPSITPTFTGYGGGIEHKIGRAPCRER